MGESKEIYIDFPNKSTSEEIVLDIIDNSTNEGRERKFVGFSIWTYNRKNRGDYSGHI